jgi:pSer/pThr/pTyr-binding forkhead associated (FHA) protein
MDIAVNGNGTPRAFQGRTLLIGKGEGCDISVAEETVSSRHAIIFTAKGKLYLRDLDSRSGTFLKGVKIHQEEFKPGDEIRVGSAKIVLAKAAEATEKAEVGDVAAASVGAEPEAAEPVTVASEAVEAPLILEPEPEPVEPLQEAAIPEAVVPEAEIPLPEVAEEKSATEPVAEVEQAIPLELEAEPEMARPEIAQPEITQPNRRRSRRWKPSG